MEQRGQQETLVSGQARCQKHQDQPHGDDEAQQGQRPPGSVVSKSAQQTMLDLLANSENLGLGLRFNPPPVHQATLVSVQSSLIFPAVRSAFSNAGILHQARKG